MIELAPIAGGQEGIEARRITRAQLVAVIRQRLEHLTAQIEAR
jgi:cell division protein FtsA